MSLIAPAYAVVNPSFEEPGLILPYAQASGAFDLLATGSPLVKLKEGDLFVYAKKIDLRTTLAASQASYEQLPSIQVAMSLISTASYLLRLRAEWNHHDAAAAARWNVAINELYRLGGRQAIAQLLRVGLLYGFNPANGEGLLNTQGATLVNLPPDTNGDTTIVTYDNGELAQFILSQILTIKQNTVQLGLPQVFCICGPQRVLGQMEYPNIVQLVQFLREGAGSTTTAGVVKDILSKNNDKILWLYDDTLIGQQIQIHGPNLTREDISHIVELASIYNACKWDEIDRAKGIVSIVWSEEKPIPLNKLKTVFDRNHNYQVSMGKKLRQEMAIKADEAILSPGGIEADPSNPFTKGLQLDIQEEDKKSDEMTEINDVITVKRPGCALVQPVKVPLRFSVSDTTPASLSAGFLIAPGPNLNPTLLGVSGSTVWVISPQASTSLEVTEGVPCSSGGGSGSVTPAGTNGTQAQAVQGIMGGVPVPVTASLGGFTPSSTGARGTPLTVTTSDSSSALPTGSVVIVSDVGSNPMYCNVNGVAATTSDQPITAGNGWFAFTIPSGVTTLHCISTSGTTTANMLGGVGLPTGTGGNSGGGGSGGTVTQGTPASASNAWPFYLVQGTTANSSSNPIFAQISAGSAAIGSITNTSFGISGSLPAFASTPAFTISGSLPAFASNPTFNQGTGASIANAWPFYLEQGGSALSVTNGLYTNLLQGNTAISAGNPLFMQLTAGSAAIGSITNTSFAATQSGTWNINNITGTISLPAGAATSALQPTNVTIGSTTSGTSGHLMMGAVTASPPSYTSGQNDPFSLDTAGNIRINCVTGCLGGGAITAASGAYSSGSLSVGAGTDGWNSTEGTKADAPCALPASTTGCSITQILKAIANSSINATPGQSNTTTNIGAVSGIVNVTPTDCSGTITTGGTAQTLISAQTTLHGFTLANVDTTTGSGEPLGFSLTGTAAIGPVGTYELAAPTATTYAGLSSYSTPFGFGTNHAVSIIAATDADFKPNCNLGDSGFCSPVKIVTPPSGWCSLIPQSGLANCWPFDTANTTTATATDVIGGKNAALSNVTLAGSGPSTNLNNAGVFNGTSSIGTTALSNLPATAFSVVIWVYRPSLSGSPRAFANDHTDADNNGFQIVVNDTPDMWIGNGTSHVNVGAYGSLTASTWTMYTWTYNGSTLIGYNGTTAGDPGTLTGPISAGSNNIAFGYDPAYSGGLISAVSSSGGLVELTSSVTNGFQYFTTGTTIQVNNVANLSGQFQVTQIDNQHVTLQGTTYNSSMVPASGNPGTNAEAIYAQNQIAFAWLSSIPVYGTVTHSFSNFIVCKTPDLSAISSGLYITSAAINSIVNMGPPKLLRYMDVLGVQANYSNFSQWTPATALSYGGGATSIWLPSFYGGSTAGSGDAFTIAGGSSSPSGTPSDGEVIEWTANRNSTGTVPTLNRSGTGAYPIYANDSYSPLVFPLSGTPTNGDIITMTFTASYLPSGSVTHKYYVNTTAATFSSSFSGTIMTASGVTGTITPDQLLVNGSAVLTSRILPYGTGGTTGTGGAGTYAVDIAPGATVTGSTGSSNGPDTSISAVAGNLSNSLNNDVALLGAGHQFGNAGVVGDTYQPTKGPVTVYVSVSGAATEILGVSTTPSGFVTSGTTYTSQFSSILNGWITYAGPPHAPNIPLAAIKEYTTRTGAGPWINIPLSYTLASSQALGTWLGQNLPAYTSAVEYSNEV
ncbi:unnamed protein product [Sphagnum balticum]